MKNPNYNGEARPNRQHPEKKARMKELFAVNKKEWSQELELTVIQMNKWFKMERKKKEYGKHLEQNKEKKQFIGCSKNIPVHRQFIFGKCDIAVKRSRKNCTTVGGLHQGCEHSDEEKNGSEDRRHSLLAHQILSRRISDGAGYP